MHIPTILEKKILRCFGPAGQHWLNTLPSLVAGCIDKWDLTDCETSEVISFNYVCFAVSPDYGEVALKIGVPHLDLNTEMISINLYAGNNICKCHDQDAGLGAMLLERISPGYDLTRLTDSSERIRAAAQLISNLPVPVKHNHGLPSWSDLAQNTFGKLRTENPAEHQMLNLVDIAEDLISGLESSGRPKVLLHGDLNHWNILMDKGGLWKAIDPKGQIGVACMESGRFILNELEIAAPIAPKNLMDQLTAEFSEALAEPRHIIALCAFLDKALGTSWKFDEHEKRDLSADVEECQFLLDYYKSLLNGCCL